MKKVSTIFTLFLFLCAYTYGQSPNLKNLRQLTFGGDNAEAYFSPDGSQLTMQVADPAHDVPCDQIYTLDLSIKNPSWEDLKLISTGKGRTTCSFFLPDGKHILYASTHGTSPACLQTPRHVDGNYVWPIYPSFDIYVTDLNGNIVRRLTDSPGYDAEAVVSPDGKKIAFTSIRSGDLEIWTMNVNGTDLRQVTDGLGYDGGAFFSHDSKKLVFRSSRPKTPEEIAKYKRLLSENLVMPTHMEIYTVNVDGSNLKQVTHLQKANWAPYFAPDDAHIIFSTNHFSDRGYGFQLFMIDTSGHNLRQVTFKSKFNAFPMFSPDGKKLAFSSNRNMDDPHETNVFLAEWVKQDPAEIVQDENLRDYLYYLSSDKLSGRLTGTDGARMASNFIEGKLKDFGLQPYNDGEYFQSFDYDVRINPHNNDKTVHIRGRNVIGVLDNNAERTIVIGAHYDHLGRNQHHNSTKMNSQGMIHNGANDNASGVTALMELARMFSENAEVENVNYIFAFFAGEEDGLIGSKYMAESLEKKYPNVIAMINMDMIGRFNEHKEIIVGGIGTSPVFGNIIHTYEPAGFAISLDSSGTGPSDHTSFYLEDIPVLFFFTGTNEDYHKPSDDADKISFYGLRAVTYYVFHVANQLASIEEIPFTKTKMKSQRKAADYKVTMGILPNYSGNGKGLRVDGIVQGRPADNAGIKQGDVITKIGDCRVKEIYSYMECLSELGSGDTREVTILRDGKELIVNVTF